MAINYYPNGTSKLLRHVIEQQQTPNRLYSVCGEKDITSEGLAVSVWSPRSWEVLRVSLNFSDSDSKDYTIDTMRGVGIVSGLNDRLWFKMDTKPAKMITIPQAFYAGSDLATAIGTAMNASELPAGGKPFVVTYDDSTNVFSVAPNAGNITLLSTNTCVLVRRDSTAARLIGFTANSAHANPIESDVGVPALGTRTVVVSGTGSSAKNIVSTDNMAMTVDNQLYIGTSTAAVIATYEVVYRILDA